MKKIHFILPVTIILMGGAANAAMTNEYPINPCDYAFDYSTCTANGSGSSIYAVNWQCRDDCEEWLARRGTPDSTRTNSTTHVVENLWTMLEFDQCPSQDDYETEVLCTTAYETSYSCAPGYYGKPTSFSSGGCTVCPANAECNGDETFLCNRGYYKYGNTCKRCPAFGSIYGTTADRSATAVTECYIPANTNMYDDTGYYKITQNCYYK